MESRVPSWTVFFEQEIKDLVRKAATQRTGDRTQVGKMSAGNTDIPGTMIEFAFAHFFNLPFDSILSDKVDPGYDFVLPDGRTVDTKGSDHPKARNLLNEVEALYADIIVAGWIRPSGGCQLMGWVTLEEWDERHKPFWNGGYCIPYELLNSMDYLVLAT